jgi:hypothetical protein
VNTESDVKQGIGWLVKLAGWNIKSIATSDDLKEHVLTFKISRPSPGWHQEQLAFEEEQPLTATVDANGHVDKIEGMSPADIDDLLQPGDLAETEEEAKAEIENAGLHIEADGTVAEGAPRSALPLVESVAVTAPTGTSTTVVDINSKKRR